LALLPVVRGDAVTDDEYAAIEAEAQRKAEEIATRVTREFFEGERDYLIAVMPEAADLIRAMYAGAVELALP
jgi:hypothetical protein